MKVKSPFLGSVSSVKLDEKTFSGEHAKTLLQAARTDCEMSKVQRVLYVVASFLPNAAVAITFHDGTRRNLRLTSSSTNTLEWMKQNIPNT